MSQPSHWPAHAVTLGVVIIHTVAPVIHESPEDTSVRRNGSAMLNCSAGGDPPPNITWWHNWEADDPLTAEPLQPVEGRLEIRSQTYQNQMGTHSFLLFLNVFLSDIGFYECRASNALGAQESNSANLTVYSQSNHR